jgi:hypothetical protein
MSRCKRPKRKRRGHKGSSDQSERFEVEYASLWGEKLTAAHDFGNV